MFIYAFVWINVDQVHSTIEVHGLRSLEYNITVSIRGYEMQQRQPFPVHEFFAISKPLR